MKRAILVVFAMLTAVLLCSCGKSKAGDVSNVTNDFGNSKVYSKDDMESAAEVVMDKFKKDFEGCTLYSLKYMGDDYCKEQLSHCKDLDNSEDFAQCMVFESSFYSSEEGEGLEADEKYDYWEWCLAREKDGSWKLLTWGY
ncbi:MAG: hypothetical protein ACI4RC_01120 [Oscillospiraceae bacterium]